MTKEEQFREAYHQSLAAQIEAQRIAQQAAEVARRCANATGIMGDFMQSWFGHTTGLIEDLRQELDKKGGEE